MINGYSSYEIQLPEGLATIWELSSGEENHFDLNAKQTEELDLLLKTKKPIYLIMKGEEGDVIIAPVIEIDTTATELQFNMKYTSTYIEDAETHIYTLLITKNVNRVYEVKMDKTVVM